MATPEGKKKVTRYRSVGGAYKRGMWHCGFGQFWVEGNEKPKYVPDENSKALNDILDFADAKGYDTTDMREQTSEWVKTGKGLTFSVRA